MKDSELLKIYMIGWNDCGHSRDNAHLYHGIWQRAYEIGWRDYLLGDDIPSVDLQTNKEILSKIKDVQLKEKSASLL